ncbi:MAG: 23S rRNA (guanosine(2251)-2'-O)-methyltransferase RlmB [Chitinophagales bacterium]
MFKQNRNDEPKNQLIYGRHPIVEALKSEQAFDKIFIQRGIQGEQIKQIIHLAKEQNVPVQFVPLPKMNRLTRKNHQGVAGFLALITYYKLEDILSNVYAQGDIPLFLIADHITDVRNFGAIARTALATGVHGIVVPAKGAANINAEALKASAGALHQIPICKVRFLDEAIQFLQSNGLQVVASDLNTDTFFDQTTLDIPSAIILGAEGKGISPKYLKVADVIAKLPMSGNFDSFNVSVATGMVLYEVMQQRKKQV